MSIKKPRTFSLIINYFECENEDRKIEYNFCLDENLKNQYVQKIFLFSTKQENPVHDKLKIVRISSEPNVQDMFLFASKFLSGENCIIANSDIVFDNTLSKVDNLSDLFLALTRWEMDGDKNMRLYRPRWGSKMSQDSWIFKSPFVPCEELGFPLGYLGADNRIAFVANKSGLKVINPSKSVITKHIHSSNYRTRAKKKRVDGEYLFVRPSVFFEVPSYYEGVKVTKGRVAHTRIASNQ